MTNDTQQTLNAKWALERFPAWLKEPNPKPFVYWRGMLCDDRVIRTWHEEQKAYYEKANTYVDKLARMVWDAYQRGAVHLVQKRLGDGVYDYIAVRDTRRLNEFGNTKKDALA